MDVSNKLNALNVNAPAFVPNVNAPVFVPGNWGGSTPEEAPKTAPTSAPTNTQADNGMQVDNPSPVGNGPGKPAADSWEDKADMSSSATTPEDEDMSMEDDSGVKKASRVKQKPVKTVESVTTEKEHVNIVFIGHVDAGKSTIGGQLMYLTNMVDKRTLEKYEKEAKEKNRETWYLSWCMDTNQEERDKGKTVEVGRAYFETEKKHFTILDAPGHKSFVPNMIGGASQADLAVLVISARKGEFETGFERGGQTREHAMLAKTAGVKHLIVLINKMDDPTVQWSEVRYKECRDKLLPYLKKVGFNKDRDLHFMPCSGQTGFNLKDEDPSLCPWYSGPAFIPYLDALKPLNRNIDGPFMMPIFEKYNDRGTIVLGKVESGSCVKNDNMLLMPNRVSVSLDILWRNEEEASSVHCGENVKVKLSGIEQSDTQPGFVLCDPAMPCKTGRKFDAQVVILEHKSIICAGYSAVCHIHSVAEEVTVSRLVCLVDKKTNKPVKER